MHDFNSNNLIHDVYFTQFSNKALNFENKLVNISLIFVQYYVWLVNCEQAVKNKHQQFICIKFDYIEILQEKKTRNENR